MIFFRQKNTANIHRAKCLHIKIISVQIMGEQTRKNCTLYGILCLDRVTETIGRLKK